MSITKREVTILKSLHTKEGRKDHQQFIVEGEKMLDELLKSRLVPEIVYSTDQFQGKFPKKVKVCSVSESELKRISHLSTPNKVIAVVKIPSSEINFKSGMVLYCCGINDPGNAGTLLRIADWFGLNGVVFTKGSVDVFSPKTVQASMGSVFRVNVQYDDQYNLLEKLKSNHFSLYAADMNGDNFEKIKFNSNAVLILGSESHGLPKEISKFEIQKITIPGAGNAESLNVAVACGIIANQMFKFR